MSPSSRILILLFAALLAPGIATADAPPETAEAAETPKAAEAAVDSGAVEAAEAAKTAEDSEAERQSRKEEAAAWLEELAPHFEVLRGYALGGDPESLETIRIAAIAAQTSPAKRAAIAGRLAALLQDEAATPYAKEFVFRVLYVIGAEQDLPAIAPYLLDPEFADMARYAVQGIPGPAADHALAEALGAAPAPLRAGLVNSLGVRGNAKAAKTAIAPFITNEDPALARAAINALGKLGAIETLRGAIDDGGPHAAALRQALLDAAHTRLDTTPDHAPAVDAFRALLEDPASKPVRIAAFHGLVQAGADPAGAMTAARLLDQDPEWFAAALAVVRNVPGARATRLYARTLEQLAPEAQTLLIEALADRGDPLGRAALTRSLFRDAHEPRAAAIAGLGRLGNAESVKLLADIAAGEGADARLARQSLLRLPGEEIDDALARLLRYTTPDVRLELIRALAGRRTESAVPALMQQTRVAIPEVREAAIRALGDAAGRAQLPLLVERAAEAETGGERTLVENAVIAAARRIQPESARAEAILPALDAAKDPVRLASLLRIGAELGIPEVLPRLQEAAASEDPAVLEAAVYGLAGWPGPEPIDTLKAFVLEAPSSLMRARAREGYLRMLRMPADRPDAETAARYAEALEWAGVRRYRQQILAGIGELRGPEALEIARSFLGHDELHAEAAVAVERILSREYRAAASHNPRQARFALDQKIDTRWSTAEDMTGGEWFEIDFSEPNAIAGLILDCSRHPEDYPRAYALYLYNDPDEPGDPVAEGEGAGPVTEIRLPEPMTGRYLRIEQRAEAPGKWWSINVLRILPAL